MALKQTNNFSGVPSLPHILQFSKDSIAKKIKRMFYQGERGHWTVNKTGKIYKQTILFVLS